MKLRLWGPDNVHPKLLKECACQVLTPLKEIFNESLKSGDLPNVWKRANVTAIFKKGNRRSS